MLRTTLNVALAFCIMFLFHSCSKEVDDSPDPVQADLRGVWEAYLYSYEGNESTVFPDDFEFTEFTGEGLDLDFFMTFSDNPNEYTLNGPYLLHHTNVHEGVEQSFLFVDVFDDVGTWSIEGNIVTLVIDGDEVTAGISELTENNLILRINTSVSVVGADNFTTTTTNMQETYHFERVSF